MKLNNRWTVLAVLFCVRCTMGIQFQSVPALSPLYLSNFALTVADLGTLIGLYFAPGVALALPGGALGQRYGEKRLVVLGLVLMSVGSLMIVYGSSVPMLFAGRLVSGMGGILMNVLMSKMVTDWFAGKEIATAMGIFVNSWPFSIAIALLVLPPLAGAYGLSAALISVAAMALTGAAVIALLYAAPPGLNAPKPAAAASPAAAGANWPKGHVLAALLVAGLIWGLYNAALAMVFSFGPTLLGEHGMSMVGASAMTSVALWFAVAAVPLGGYIADRLGKHDLVMVVGFIGFAVSIALAARMPQAVVFFALIGLIGGVSAGPIMSLPARILTPATRAVGMGIFFTVFYAVQLTAPALSGALAKSAGSARVTFDVGAAMLVACLALLPLYYGFRRRSMALMNVK